jgi:hypothetical protein
MKDQSNVQVLTVGVIEGHGLIVRRSANYLIRWSPYKRTTRRIAHVPAPAKQPQPRLSDAAQADVVIAAYLLEARGR